MGWQLGRMAGTGDSFASKVSFRLERSGHVVLCFLGHTVSPFLAVFFSQRCFFLGEFLSSRCFRLAFSGHVVLCFLLRFWDTTCPLFWRCFFSLRCFFFAWRLFGLQIEFPSSSLCERCALFFAPLLGHAAVSTFLALFFC